MTEYNHYAWDKLLELVHLTPQGLFDVFLELGIQCSYNTFISWRRTGGIPPGHLATVCNYFHYPISFFVKVNGRETESRDYSLCPEEEWTDVVFRMSRFYDFLTGVEHRRRPDAIKTMGCSPKYYDALRKYTGTLPDKLSFADLLSYINNARMYPGDIIIDGNEIFPLEYGIKPFYEHAAMNAYDALYPQPKTVFAASEIIDTKDFLLRYVSSVPLEGDDKIIATSVRTFNEIASIITNLRSELYDVRQRLKEMEEIVKGETKNINNHD